jgi:hypothetical protein
METETTFILLFAVASAVALLARRLRIPYTVALVSARLVLGGLDLIPAPELTKNLLFTVFHQGALSRETQQKRLADIDACALKADLNDIPPRTLDEGNTGVARREPPPAGEIQ